VRFAHPSHDVARERYEQTFAAPVTFGCSLDELEFDAAQLDLRLATADPITSAALEARVAVLAAATTARSPFIDSVRRAIAPNLAEPASLAKIARQLGISARTLRRQLEREGSSLGEDRVRDLDERARGGVRAHVDLVAVEGAVFVAVERHADAGAGRGTGIGERAGAADRAELGVGQREHVGAIGAERGGDRIEEP